MKRIHLLRTTSSAFLCQPLFEAAAALGIRVGWLDLESAGEAPSELEEAANLGAFRAVGVSRERVVAVKPVGGAKVVEDLLREYFAGCRLVVVRGQLDRPELTTTPTGYRIRFDDDTKVDFSAEALAKALRRPHLRRPCHSGAGVPDGSP